MMSVKEVAKDTDTSPAPEPVRILEMPSALPPTIKLTAQERLEIENVQLKSRLLDIEYQGQRRRLVEQQERFVAAVTSRTGIDVRRYTIDVQSGSCRLQQEVRDGR